MRVLDWLRNLARSTQEPASTSARQTATPVDAAQAAPALRPLKPVAADDPPVLSGQEKSAMVVGGLNFMDAITAHQKWKTRLASYLEGTSTEKLDYRVVCRDDQCVLGKWINGPGGDAYGHIPIFSQLKMTHAQFHLAAATVVRFQDDGKPEKAQEALRQGSYPQHSIKVQGLISSLYIEVKGLA
jgi:Chemoreceptor zinc-binding domain